MTPRTFAPRLGAVGLNWADGAVFLALVGGLATLAWLGHGLWAPFTPDAAPTLELDPWWLPYYAARSLLRMFAALGAALAFTLVVASWAARSARAGRVILPALDILQSVPVLGFLSATVTFFIAIVPGHVLGLELASIFAIFTSQVWNLTFAFHQVLVTLPREQAEALRLYRVSGWQRFTHFELPAGIIPLVWNGMMSFGGGWFFLAASEAITVLNRELLLPGVGSFMALAVKAADVRALGWAVLTMVVLILMVDAVVWRPLVAWSEKFKVEESQATDVPSSRVLDVLRRSHLVLWVGAGLARLDERLDRGWRRWLGAPGAGRPERRRWGRALTAMTWTVIALLALRGAAFVMTALSGAEVVRVLGLGALTLLRVAGVVALAALVWTPIGTWIGMNPRVARFAQPIVQVLASFPANFLFPLVALVFVRFGLSLEWGGALLMALGAQWYVLFNTIAGATAIPNDLREMARNLGVRRVALWRALILPAIFPAWVTGGLTAAGGAWNASIVAEVVTWGGTTLQATGVGAYVAAATAVGDWPRIVLGVAVMSAYVVALNRLVWRRLERLAVARYSLAA
ncbi:MAG TPA: ABC transporter permease subunit [Methylomirabilota bacterium]|nr:ABC transporter permease subunit [Methylomirabilota bacterium]